MMMTFTGTPLAVSHRLETAMGRDGPDAPIILISPIV
jgi:hypothetical protein